MTSLMERPTAKAQRHHPKHPDVDLVTAITADPGHYSMLKVAQAYSALCERPIPLCDANHAFANPSSARYAQEAATDAWKNVREFLHTELR